jgi:site-specific recombinase XerD
MITMRDALVQYVALRRALGTQLQEPAVALVHFLEFLERQGAEFITSELALRWAMEPRLVQRATWARRLGMVRRFASWLSTIDPRTEVPPRRLLAARRRRNKPHIFSELEIARLMDEATKLSSPSGLRAMTYMTLIGLLSVTGLRPGEALALDVGDVDLQNGILAIRESKFGKSRFVPVEDSTRTALTRYAEQRDKLRPRAATEGVPRFRTRPTSAWLCSPPHVRHDVLLHRPADAYWQSAHRPWTEASGFSSQFRDS